MRDEYDEIERRLIAQIMSIQRDYESLIAPYVAQLAEIRAMRPPVIWIPVDAVDQLLPPETMKKQ